MADLMAAPVVTRVGPGMYRVEHDGRSDIVYVAGTKSDRSASWNGAVFRRSAERPRPSTRTRARTRPVQSLVAPMPATVAKVLVQPGAKVTKGETVLLLEAMKMELPIRAPADAIVTAVHCREGGLVQAGAVLVELE
jgi:3-methylcrotonyl-CoA carboxylase alpha subunit